METRAASVETLYTIDPKTGMTPLQVAVKKRQWDEVTKIITTPQLDHKKARSGFALLIAAKENLTTIALTLLETVTDFSYSTGKNGYLAMHWAVANNNLELLTAMIAKGADANSTTKYQQTPLMLAVTLDDINMELLAILCEQTKSFGETVKQAAKDGHWQTVTRLLTVDKLNEQTLCAELLFTAIDQRQLDAINMLLNKGVAYNFFQNGVSAIVHAAKAEYWECVTILMQHPRSGCSISELGLALTIVVAKQNWELATNILKLRPKLDKSFENFTLAQWVIKHNHVEFFNELHQAGTDILTNENNLTTAVQMAVQLRSTDILKRLSVLGVKLDNAITTAVSTKEKGDLQFLIENGGNPAAAFAKAVQDKKWDDVKLLVEASGKQFTKSLTRLFKAVIDDNKPEMVTFLLTHGADPHQTFEGQDNTDTPARYAAQAKKWDCVRAIINSPTKICPNKAKLGSALIIAAEQDQWELFSEILKRKPQLTWRYSDSGFYAVHFVIKAQKHALLTALLEAGANANEALNEKDKPDQEIKPSPLELAESLNDKKSIDLLIEYGANHNTALERAAKAKRYPLLLELIKKHYHDHPNKNETESAKRKILGDLLFTLGEKQEKNTFAALLAQGADITLNQDESCLLSHLTKHKSWDCMKVLLSEFPLGSPFNQSQVHQSIIQAISSNAPDDIMTKLFSMTAADIKDITCNNTGNNALHAAVQADNPETLEKYLAIGVDPHAKNKAKQTPYTLLLKLDHDEKSTLKQSEKMALLLAKTDEHIQGNKFEKITDNMQVKSVIASRITCLHKLAARYNPAPSFASARDEYTAFVEAQQDYDTTKKDSYYFRFGDECVKTALPLVWSAIKDETALPANAPEWLKEDSETGKRNRAIYIETRKKSLIEKLQQAAEGKSCDNGTVTKILEAINLAHPDVVIVYDKQQIIGEIQDNVRHFMATKMDILVASLPPQEQRALYREVQLDEDNDNIPKVFHLASQHLATSLIPQYGAFEETITLDEINQLISPKRLSYIMNLSWPNDIKNVQALVNEIMAVTETPHEAAAKYLTVAQELASHVFEPDNQHSFLDDIASLQKAWTDYKDALAAKQLAIVSFIGGTSPATTQSVDAEPYKADCFTK